MRLRTALLALAWVVVPILTAAQTIGGDIDLSSLRLPAGFLEMSDLAIGGDPGGGLTAIAQTTLNGAATDVLVAVTPGADGKRVLTLALRPNDWSLTKAIPALANPALGDMTLSDVTLVLTYQDVRISSADLTDDQYAFYRKVYNADDFTLVLKPGVNLIAAIPVDRLSANNPLVVVMNALGIERGTVLLQGTLGKSLSTLGSGAGAGAIKDLYLRAELPPMRPPGSPQWFRSGQLALELTGDPSVRLVGDMEVLVDQADLQFFLAAMLARTGASLSGGMKAVRPWVAPFGIQWLTMKTVILKIGITPTGSVALGFAGAAVIGEKDIDVAVALAVSPAGVPTNFMMKGESDSGVGISDLARVQAGMAGAREAAAGATGLGSGAPLIPLDALPDIQIRALALQFAPQPDLDLGIERGFKVKGRLWIPTGSGRDMRNFAGVDAEVSDQGMWVRGDLSAFQLGPLTWDDAKLDLTATRQDQHLIVKGQVKLGTSRQLVDLSMSRDALRFKTETELFNLFHASLTAQSAFDLRNPSFAVDAIVSNDFGEFVQPVLRDGIVRFASTGQGIVNGAETALGATRQALAMGQATAAQLRAVLATQRANAEAAWRAAQARTTSALADANAARAARDAAQRLWQGTPLRQPALRAARHAEFVRLAAVFAARVAQYATLQTGANARRAILDAIPPVDKNVLLLRADAAVAELRSRLEEAQRSLNALATRYAQMIAAVKAGADPLAIEHAEFHANLAVVQGGGATSWILRGTFVGQPFELKRELDFGSPAQAVAAILTGLVQG
ncbi:MAG: hypothetical protein E6J18_15375 [Chloroflexi bacterium]|nr:MAG: hypothetical protein E6J18_15375 [Chloroflexota bacterium]